MRYSWAWLVLALACRAETSCRPQAPCYSEAGIVNAASYKPNLAPFTWASIYGTNLAYVTQDRSTEESPGVGGVDVFVNGQPAMVSYVSPLQVNFLLPGWVAAPQATIQVVREGTAGPAVLAGLDDSAPALFQMDAERVVGVHLDWTLVTRAVPARAGELIVVYATGLGPFESPLEDWEIPRVANPIRRRAEFSVLLDGEPLEQERVPYAGAAPFYIGLYQINVRLPDRLGKDPEIRILLGEHLSPAGLHLIVE